MLAVHFTIWFFSLKFVSVAVTTTIVDATPIFLAILGIILAFIGGTLLTFSKNESYITNNNPLLGILLATIGAITVSIYLVIGKKILKDSPLWPYFGLLTYSHD